MHLPWSVGVEVDDLARGRKLPLSLRSQHQLRVAHPPSRSPTLRNIPSCFPISSAARRRSPGFPASPSERSGPRRAGPPLRPWARRPRLWPGGLPQLRRGEASWTRPGRCPRQKPGPPATALVVWTHCGSMPFESAFSAATSTLGAASSRLLLRRPASRTISSRVGPRRASSLNIPSCFRRAPPRAGGPPAFLCARCGRVSQDVLLGQRRVHGGLRARGRGRKAVLRGVYRARLHFRHRLASFANSASRRATVGGGRTRPIGSSTRPSR
jgi:hypothetical protein